MKLSFIIVLNIITILSVICYKHFPFTLNSRNIYFQSNNAINRNTADLNRNQLYGSINNYDNIRHKYTRENNITLCNTDHSKLVIDNNNITDISLKYISSNTENLLINTFTTAKYGQYHHRDNNNNNSFEMEDKDNTMKNNLQKYNRLKRYKRKSKVTNALLTTSPSLSLTTNEKPVKEKKTKILLPFMNMNIGLKGSWECRYESFVLKPNPSRHQTPIGIIHFLGGAFVGAAPHITYRYFLEQLSEQGYIIIATPYRLQLDYLSICDHVLSNFGTLTTELNIEYGYNEEHVDDNSKQNRIRSRLPIIGIGHSSGAFLHSLISSLFPDIPRAANILISYNNRPSSDSVPVFNDLLVPVSTQIARLSGSNAENTETRNTTSSRSTLSEAMGFLRRYINLATNIYSESTISPSFVSNEVIPLVRQGLELVDQIPPLLGKLSRGQEQFTPSPSDALECVRRNYRTPYTLLLRFADDLELDQSEELLLALKESNTIMKMRKNRLYEELVFEMHVIKDGKSTTSLSQSNLLSGLSSPLKLFNPKRKSTSDKNTERNVRLKLGKMFYGRIKLIHDEINNFLNTSIPLFVEQQHHHQHGSDKNFNFGKTKHTVVAELKKKYVNNHANTGKDSGRGGFVNNIQVKKMNTIETDSFISVIPDSKQKNVDSTFVPQKSFLINSETSSQSSKLLSSANPVTSTRKQSTKNILTILPASRISPSQTAANEEALEDNFFQQRSTSSKPTLSQQPRILKHSNSISPQETLNSKTIRNTSQQPNNLSDKVHLNKIQQKRSVQPTIRSSSLPLVKSNSVLPTISVSTNTNSKAELVPPIIRPYNQILLIIKLKLKIFFNWIYENLQKLIVIVKKFNFPSWKGLYNSNSKRYAIDFDWDMMNPSTHSRIFPKSIQKKMINLWGNVEYMWNNNNNIHANLFSTDRMKRQFNIFQSRYNEITFTDVSQYIVYHIKLLLQHTLIVVFWYLF